jgi:hypothetical protein
VSGHAARSAVRSALVIALLVLPQSASAQGGVDDDLFGGGGLVTDVAPSGAEGPADDPFAAGGVRLGGDVTFAARMELDLDAAEDEAALTAGLDDLSARLFLDARPTGDLRAYLEGQVSYRTEAGLELGLREAFLDVTVLDTVFVRAGKQTLNWGVGTFYSPANLLNTERLDPETPDAELDGPVAAKAQLPIGSDNLTGYLVLDDLGEDADVAAAARYEFLLEGYEVTTGAVVHAGGPWALMATATGAIGDVTVFAEAVVRGASDKVFVEPDATLPAGYRTTTSDAVFGSATVGGRYDNASDDGLFSVSMSAQYYLNGLGYADPYLFVDDPAALAFALGQIDAGVMRSSDLTDRGRHNAAVRVASSDIGGTDLTASVLWLANLSDGSGLVRTELAYTGIDHVTLSLGSRYAYGPDGAEYSLSGASHTIDLTLTVDGAF